jgi:hypothetical protein
MPTYYDHGLGIDTTSQITSSGDELAAAANYTEPENVDFGYFTWENQPISKTVTLKLRDEDFPQLSSSLIYITIPSGSPHNIYDSTNTVLVSGNAQENNDRDFTLDYTLRGATTDTGNLTEDNVWSFTTAALEFGNTEVVVGINSNIGIRDTVNMIISRTPTLGPIVTITTETSATTATEITIDGTASDPNSLPFTVTYELSGARTDTGTAVGTDNWTFTEGLSAGDNRFDVTATNTWNLAGSDSLIVTYSPPVNGGEECGPPGDHFCDEIIDPLWTVSVQGGGTVTEPVGTELVISSSAFIGYLTGSDIGIINGCYRNTLISGDFDKTVVVTDITTLGGTEETAFVASVDSNEFVWIDPYTNLIRGHHYFPGTTGSDQDVWDMQFPVFLRITRVSDIFYTYWSQNGTDWTELIPGGLGRLNDSRDVTIWIHCAGLFSGFDTYWDWYGDTVDLPDDW